MSTTYMTVRIMSPVALVWESEVARITAENSEGLFDILPDHARFMSLIHKTPIIFELPDGSEKKWSHDGKVILFFEDNVAVVYVQDAVKKESA